MLDYGLLRHSLHSFLAMTESKARNTSIWEYKSKTQWRNKIL
ncbi:hypothetical protein [Helicobacter rodentium]|nr:hypothetical protein [Helicobacter rodentium]